MNSLRKEITAATLAGEIRLERAVHKGSFLLVEGPTDARFFKQQVDQVHCSVTVCHGRETLLGAIERIEQFGIPGVLGVVDADYCILLGSAPPGPNVIVTDYNDLEVVILASSVFSRILLQYGSEDKIAKASTGSDIWLTLVEQASFIGRLRFQSKAKGWRLKFQGMTYQFVSNSAVEIDRKRTLNHILAISGAGAGVGSDELQVAAEEALPYTSLQLCCGHDLCRILARSLRHWVGSHAGFENDAADLGRVLRLAFSENDFRKTGMFGNIVSWETKNPPFRVFRYPG